MKIKKLKFSLTLLVLLLIGSTCKKDDKLTVCGVENPLENLDWLKAYEPNPYEASAPDIYYVKYSSVDYIAFHYPNFSDPFTIVYSCEGIEVCRAGYPYSGDYCYIWYDADKKILLNKK